eukprot:scaffold211441_cov30-Prasinocladus_malaysianus.AAC.1
MNLLRIFRRHMNATGMFAAQILAARVSNPPHELESHVPAIIHIAFQAVCASGFVRSIDVRFGQLAYAGLDGLRGGGPSTVARPAAHLLGQRHEATGPLCHRIYQPPRTAALFRDD